MSAPPSPHIVHVSHASSFKKRDHPPDLDIPDQDRKAVSDGEVQYGRDYSVVDVKRRVEQPLLSVSLVHDPPSDHDGLVSRSASATSSLDPYYFGLQSPSASPVPPLPTSSIYLSTTPEQQQQQLVEPVTPARNPAGIDRRGLVGVGELATPRWTRTERNSEELELDQDIEAEEGYDIVVPQDTEDDQPDSPWTIEAVDGESSEKDQPADLAPPLRLLRTRPSIADESGGEEILYPRKFNGAAPDMPKVSIEDDQLADRVAYFGRASDSVLSTEPASSSSSPPSAFSQPVRRAKKRSSDEFELDQTGTLTSKHAGSTVASKDRPKDDKSSRKHRSLNVNLSPSRDNKGKERRRESIGLSISNLIKSPSNMKAPEQHARQISASSSSSNPPDSHYSRRVLGNDFSHLPPSPSSSSIQQFLLHTTVPTTSHTPPLNSASKDNLQHSSPSVAHSLLRGTQEGWSGLDDEATAEALRKLDGLTGKNARARASVASFGRASSSSRPGTPAGKSGTQWEGVKVAESGKSRRTSGNIKETSAGMGPERQSFGLGLSSVEGQEASETIGNAVSSDEQPLPSGLYDKTLTKSNVISPRTSFTPKRGSTSSTAYGSTPTTSSRDSASISAGTSATSMSGTSGRYSTGKARRNSASSDTSVHSSDVASLKDRVASLAVNGEPPEDAIVPPVPPLPKDFSTYRSPPPTSSGLAFPSLTNSEDKEKRPSHESNFERTASLDVPIHPSLYLSSPGSQGRGQNQRPSSGNVISNIAPEQPVVLKTPSKKWSFSSALNLKLSSSPSSSSSQKSGFPLSPRAVTFGQQLRKSTSKDQSMSSTKGLWSTKHPEAMASAGSLVSLSSVGSLQTPGLPSTNSKTPDRAALLSRPGTGSSASTNHTAAALSAPQPGPLSPTSSSVRRGQSKRLTPSSIPFFRRSSSQSMQIPPSGAANSSSPTNNVNVTQTRSKTSPPRDYASLSTSVPGSTHKKSSVLSLGLPSLLKSSSRRSLHSDAKESAKELQKVKDAARDSEKERIKQEKEKHKKEDKDRSESRISVLIHRKRGKTLSSTDPRKPKSPVNLPPMQISAIEPATAQRVAKLKSNSTTASAATPMTTRTSSSSRLLSQTASSMQKQSDTSLRSRSQLPTIAGSPSVGINGTASSTKEPPSSLNNSTSGLPKETPTKIPRISSRTSAVSSPPLKHSSSALGSRRTSVNITGLAPSSANPSPTAPSTNEFGVMESEDGTTPKTTAVGTKQTATRGSPSTSTSRVPRQSAAASTGSFLRKSNRDSVSFIGLRKSSTGSVASMSAPAAGSTDTSTASTHRFSALSPSKGLKLLGPKSLGAAARTSNVASQNIHQAMGSPSSSRQSLSTPSPAPSSVDEEEALGDEEMMHYIRRQQAKKLASGATQEELDELLKFPEPTPPGTPSSPASILKGSQAQYLSEYERKEILDYPSVYCVGSRGRKKLAVLENSTNNYGYDDERGDYLVVNHDHLAYRYEVIDTLGKGSFGQVLHCRDHSTGESVAIKIIRNKKRFHHQALVEIKILDNLRKWDSDEKHHVIKMTEHFYFRNHLCIAMELLSINLYELIKANGFVGFTTALIRRFTSQMLLSLSLMRHHRIVHCDLKPENVLLRHPAKSAIKVIDFGSSCFEHEKIYTYIQSRFYRSPEVILGMNYHMAIDMWSLGCILAELYTGFPIFPGENEQEQLSCIMEVLGVPDKEFVNRSSRKKLFFDTNGAPRTVINSKGRRRRPGTKTLAQVLRCNDEEFVDFISKCLVWDPERRIKPQAAMRHPFLTSGRRPKPSTTSKQIPSSNPIGTRSKPLTETPKKSLISGPAPLTARSSRTAVNGGPTTPNGAHASTLGSSSRSYRSSQPQGLGSYSSRTLSGFASSSTK